METKNEIKPVALQTETRGREARILLLLGIPIIVIAIAVIVVLNSRRAPTVASTDTVDEAVLVRAGSPFLGPADAPVTVVEFLDPECESCRAAAPFVKQLLERYDGRIRVVVRYFPLHRNSILAAVATEAAGAQGKYWEMQELLFNRQLEWGEQQSPQQDLILRYAAELGLDMDQFVVDVQNPEYVARIERDQTDGRSLGVTGTPTFFVNGQRVTEANANVIIAMIEEALSISESN